MDLNDLKIIGKHEGQYHATKGDIELIYNFVKDVEIGKSVEFDYRKTEDFKHPIPDFTGFINKLRSQLKYTLVKLNKAVMIIGERETGIIRLNVITPEDLSKYKGKRGKEV